MSDTETGRVERAANLFDLRRIIGGLFTIWGVLLIILGITDSDAEAHKAAGININLDAGIGMLILGLIFVAWALTRPLGTEIAATEESDEGGGGTGRDRDRAPGEREAGT
jgi:hypothetical membrane protein